MHFDCIERRLSQCFCRFASVIARWPLPFIVIPIMVTLSMSLGFVWRFEVVKDDLDLYTPIDGPSKLERKSLQRYFDIKDSDKYFAQRRFNNKRMGFIIVMTKDQQNVLTKPIFDEILYVWDKIHLMQFSMDEKNYSYNDLCVRTVDRQCVSNPILKIYSTFDETKRPIFFTQFLTYGTYLNFIISKQVHNGSTALVNIFIANVLGTLLHKDTEANPSDLIETKAILLPYQLRYSNQTMNKLAEKWEIVLNHVLTSLITENITLHWWTSETLTIETKKDTEMLWKLMVPMFILVTMFTIGCSFVNNCLRSKPWLSLCGIVSTALSIVSSMGILLYCGAKLTSVTYFVPFLTFSIGVDNVFILIGAWRKSSVFATVEARMVHSFGDAAVSITVTSLTDAISFAVGCMTTYPSVRSFCLYSCVAIIFVYCNQLTFFAGCMVVSGDREREYRNCITLRKMAKKKEDIQKEKSSIREGHHLKQTNFTDEGISDHAAARFFKGPYTSFLLHPVTKVVVFVVLFVYLVFGIWGVRDIVIGIHPTDLLSKKSAARITLNLQTEYFSDFSDYLHLWYTDLEKYENQTTILSMLNEELKMYEFTKYSFTAESWYREFLEFQNQIGLTVNNSNFVSIVKDEFLNNSHFDIFKHDIRFTNDTLFEYKISAVRFLIRLCNVTFRNQYVATHYFRDLLKNSSFEGHIHVYHEFFEFGDQFDSIVPSLFSNMVIGSAAVVIVSLLLIPKPLCSIWVCVTIVSINVGILGYMSWWNVHLDFISMVTIVMSIGASVDFSAHIAYHFAKSELLKAKERISDSLYVVGTPILQSAFSTWLGIALIAVIDSYSFGAFVKTASLVILFGLMHGLIVLPVLLAVFHFEKECKSAWDSSSGSSINHKEPSMTKECPVEKTCDIGHV